VLIITTRPVARVADLVPAELSDIMLTAQTVSRMIESRFKSTGVTFAIQVTIGAVMSILITLIVGVLMMVSIQDGASAGQTVPHVHMHVIPRHLGDFERSDQVYDEV